MNCMKCGRDTPLGQAFCKECLADMKEYPIKPGTPVNIPSQPSPVSNRRTTQNRKARKPEEQVVRLRRLVRIQALAMIIMLVAFCVTLYFFNSKLEDMQDTTVPGQNYSSIEETT